MSGSLPAVIPDLVELGTRAADFARASRAPATVRAYSSDWTDFARWCDGAGLAALPAEPTTIGAYLSDRAGALKVSTLSRRIAAITAAHRFQGFGLDSSHPAIARVLAGICRTYGTRADAKTAILTEDLRRIIKALPDTLAGKRDRAVLLVGFAGAFRRSELVALNRADIEISTGGATIVIRRSKTDQAGAGREVGIPRSRRSATCPVTALDVWLQEIAKFLNLPPIHLSGSDDEDGAGGCKNGRKKTPRTFTPDQITNIPVFRAIYHGKLGGRLSGDGVAQIVKRAAVRVGLDPRKFAGHSLRSGFCTSAARGGADLSFIMAQTGHKNADVARKYVQTGKLLQNPASKAVKL